MGKQDEQVLLQSLQQNDRSALKVLFDTYYTELCKTAYRLLKDPDQVEDTVQQVFIRFWEKRGQLKIESSLQAYLHRMTINESIAYLRKQKRRAEQELPQNQGDLAPDVETTFLTSELQEHILKAIAQLPPACQAIFRLSRMEGLSYKEIAAKQQLSIKTVENQMGKALRILRVELSNYLQFLPFFYYFESWFL